jgi:hypothetical protein
MAFNQILVSFRPDTLAPKSSKFRTISKDLLVITAIPLRFSVSGPVHMSVCRDFYHILTTITLNHTVATMTLNTTAATAALGTTAAFVIPLVILLTSSAVWRKEHLRIFVVLQRVYLSSLVRILSRLEGFM